MIRDDLFLKVFRRPESWNYKIDKQKNTLVNNTLHNAMDSMLLFKVLSPGRYQELFRCDKMQTVANHPDYDFYDTIRQGHFKCRCFAENKGHFGQDIHEIIDAFDIEGQWIDDEAKQTEDGKRKGRWLIHSTWDVSGGKDISVAYSGGCPMFLHTEDLKRYNEVLRILKVAPGDIIPGYMQEL